eukprot:jgi/Botrbrau1/20741/Bobra.0058s0069.1
MIFGGAAHAQFDRAIYQKIESELQGMQREHVVSSLKRNSTGFARGQSKYRGVTKHHHQGRWEARIGRVEGNRYLYLGTFDNEEDAARAYDRAALQYRRDKAVTNFSVSDYLDDTLEPTTFDVETPPDSPGTTKHGKEHPESAIRPPLIPPLNVIQLTPIIFQW